jgi:hypothetical protein
MQALTTSKYKFKINSEAKSPTSVRTIALHMVQTAQDTENAKKMQKKCYESKKSATKAK